MKQSKNTQSKNKPGKVENPVLKQGQRRREKDKLRDDNKLQENQHKLDIKRDKNKSVTPTLILIITTISLAFTVFAYYKWL